MNVLGIETSCDETACAVVSDNGVLSNVVYSQIADHAPYGGVVPEIASRRHVDVLPDVLSSSLSEAGLDWADIDRIAVTAGPGLAGALLIGLNAAKALSLATGIPLFAVHHLQGHLASVFLGSNAPDPNRACPMLVLLVSGGHTGLVRVERPGDQTWMGRSLDDAAGEALDKGAKLLGLSYPGGPAIEQAAAGGDPTRVPFPRGRIKRDADMPTHGLDPDLCFSFSGLKTSLLYYLKEHVGLEQDMAFIRDVSASYQAAVVDALCARIDVALKRHTWASLACVGGVARNRLLRSRLAGLAEKANIPLFAADPAYCTDNAAMIAAAGHAGIGEPVPDLARLDVRPSWPL